MKLGYLISSHIAYQAPRERLLASMAGIDPAQIIVVVGGAALSADIPGPGIRHVFVPYTAFEYTALIDYVEHPDDYPDWSHVFLLHDTMELGPDADRLIRAADPDLDAVAVWGGQCNLALYRVDFLHRRALFITALKNCTKLAAVESEGMLWRSLSPDRRGTYGGECIDEGVAIVYGGAARRAERYTGVDIVKYKANWGQTWPPSVVTP